MKKVLATLYTLGLMGLTLVFMVVIWNLTFAHLFKEYHSRKKVSGVAEANVAPETVKSPATFKEAILESEKRVKHYLGYRVLEERHIKDHFHHIDFDFHPDKISYCIECHGDIPHDKIKEVRAFANMHASFLSCQTCHVRLEGEARTGVFKWYDRTTGEIVASPDMAGSLPGAYRSKIVPFEKSGGKLQRVDTSERINFSREYRQMEPSLSDTQKSKAKKIIHNNVSAKPYICEDCHQREVPVLPFRALGYPQNRIDAIANTEIIGMIKNYTQFYMPRMLQPGFGKAGE